MNPQWQIMAAPQRLVPLTIILTPSSLFLARVFREWTYRDDAANSDSVLYMFGLGFVPGMLLSIFIECLLSVLIAMLFVNDYFEEILRLMLEQSTPSDPAAKTALIWQRVLTSVGILRVVAMAVLLCFVVAGLVEETVKLALVAPLPCSPVNTMPDLGRSHKVLAGVAAFSIGFAVSESIA
jgi:RsiW-degrading membrane proteinase PrsW (M82 family)